MELDHLIAAHRPGHALDQPFYTSPEVFARDCDAIFFREWLLTGHVSELPETGSFFVFEMMNEQVILTRDATGRINALANVCRHRGARVCAEPRGTARRFTCPYHAWSYELDGSLFSARLLDPAHDRAALGLKRLAVEVFHGLIYISFAERPARFDALRAALDPHVAPFDLARTRIAHRISYPVAANWKLLVENYNECYHCTAAHPEFSRSHVIHMPPDRAAPLNAAICARSAECGISTGFVDAIGELCPEGSPDHSYNRYALFEGYQTGSADGQPVAPLLGDLRGHDGGASDVYVGILNPMLVYADHAVLYRFIPVDKDRSVQEIIWLVHEDAVEGRDYDRDRLTWLWDVTTEADKAIIEANQSGIRARHYEPGPFVSMEQYAARFVAAYLARLGQSADQPQQQDQHQEPAHARPPARHPV